MYRTVHWATAEHEFGIYTSLKIWDRLSHNNREKAKQTLLGSLREGRTKGRQIAALKVGETDSYVQGVAGSQNWDSWAGTITGISARVGKPELEQIAGGSVWTSPRVEN